MNFLSATKLFGIFIFPGAFKYLKQGGLP